MRPCWFGAALLAVALPLGCIRLDELPREAPSAAREPTTTNASTTATSTSGTASTAISANPSPSTTSTATTSTGKVTAADPALGRAAFSRHCGECHDGRLPTAKAKALGVFDLADTRWIERLSPRRFEAAKAG